jgi:hypothetical protein
MISFLLNPDRTNRRAALASLVIAFAIASFFYEFHSFALECIAFLATWTLLDLPAQWLAALFAGEKGRDSSAA